MNEEKKMAHRVLLDERKHLEITGVKDVDNYDDELLVIYSEGGEMTIKGENIRVTEFSSETGDLIADGTFSSFSYSERLPKGSGFFARVFK